MMNPYEGVIPERSPFCGHPDGPEWVCEHCIERSANLMKRVKQLMKEEAKPSSEKGSYLGFGAYQMPDGRREFR